jgi:hypothetical protein
MLSRLGKKIPDYFINNAQNLIKERRFIAPLGDMNYFSWYFASALHLRQVGYIEVPCQDRKLRAHTLQLHQKTHQPAKPSVKKAIIYMLGNCHYVAEHLPKLEPLLKTMMTQTAELGIHADYTLFCQDYRGRGFNQVGEEENWNDYPLSQDVDDQANLIKYLVEEQGYEPKNILVVAYSYGSAMGLWAVYNLIRQYGVKYADLKLYSDRGYGNLLDFPLVNVFLDNQQEAHKRLHALKVMPDIFLHSIAEQLPESFATNVENEVMMKMNIALVESLKQEEMEGRVWVTQTDNAAIIDAHLASHDAIHLKSIPQVKAYHFMLAMQHQLPIKLQLAVALPTMITGYALKENAKPGDDDFVAFSPPALRQDEEVLSSAAIVITDDAVANLLSRLHTYCLERAEQARKSGLGALHNRAWLSQSGMTGWTAKQQIESAMEIMRYVAGCSPTDISAVKALQQKSGPHQSGRLNRIFVDVARFMQEYQSLHKFNEWVLGMDARRLMREQQAAESEVDLRGIFLPDPSIATDWLQLNPPVDWWDFKEEPRSLKL